MAKQNLDEVSAALGRGTHQRREAHSIPSVDRDHVVHMTATFQPQGLHFVSQKLR